MVPLLAIVAWSGTGKTTLLKQLIPVLKARGIRPGLIKHTQHNVDIDTPGKDSYELRKAGADQVMIANAQRWTLITETPQNEKFDLHFLASRMDTSSLDIILAEGFKHERVTKIVLWREGTGRDLQELLDKQVIAIASDTGLALDMPVLDLNAPDQIADFIISWLSAR